MIMWVVDPGSWGPHCRVLFIKRSNTLLDHTFTNNSYLNKLFGLGGKIYTYVTYVKTSLKSCSKNPPLKDAPLDPFRFIPTNSSDATTFFSQKKQPPGVSVHHCCDSELIVCPGWFWHRLRVEVRKPRRVTRGGAGRKPGGAVLQWVVC